MTRHPPPIAKIASTWMRPLVVSETDKPYIIRYQKSVPISQQKLLDAWIL